MPCRTLVKQHGIFLTLWSKERNFDVYDKVIFALHGCPSHPYDHLPYNFDWFFENGYIVIFPNYYGTRWSDGICTFDNCTDTIVDLLDMCHTWPLINTYDNTQINLQGKQYILFGASFGWYVVLSAWATSKHTQTVIACSPVTDRETHNNDWNEADMHQLVSMIKTQYSNLRRSDQSWQDILQHKKFSFSKKQLVDGLSQKNVLILHGKDDPQVQREKSRDFIDTLRKTWWRKHQFVPIAWWWHTLLHHFSHPEIQPHIVDFLRSLP